MNLIRVWMFVILTLPNSLYGQIIPTDSLSGEEICPVPLRENEAYVLTLKVGACVLKRRCPCPDKLREKRCCLHEIEVLEVHYLRDTTVYNKETVHSVKYMLSNSILFEGEADREIIVYCTPSPFKECISFSNFSMLNPEEVEFFHPVKYYTYGGEFDCLRRKRDPFARYIEKQRKKK